MKNILIPIFLILSLTIMTSTSFAKEKKSWLDDFENALIKGKADIKNASEGLGYTPDEATVLEKAIKTAMKAGAPPCEAIKSAVKLDYKAYGVITNIYSAGGQVNLDQLCMCATENGISSEVVAQAAKDATSPLGTPVFKRDEITQAQCLGLGYTPEPLALVRTEKRKVSP